MKRLSLTLAAFLLALPIHAAWRSEGPFVGAIVDVAIDPAKPDTLYAASHSGGVWRSDDGGKQWMLPGDGMVHRPVEWIEVDPGNPATIWAGIDSPGRPALWRSPDRGKTWAPVRPEKGSYMVGQRIAFAPSNPAIIYAPSTNLHYRSSDGGKTWESFRVPNQDAYAFAIDPKNPKVIYAGGRGSEHQMRRSSDGGMTWKPVGEGLPETSIKLLAIPRERASTVYVVMGFGQLFKTGDGGDTWTELDLGLQGTDDLFSLDIDPHDPLTLFAGTENGLRKSTDGGESWSTVGGGLGNWYCKGVALHPKEQGVVYAGTTGKGFFRSTDGGETFEPLSNGLAAGWTEKIYAPPEGGPIFAQLSVGLYRQDGPGAWTELQAPFDPGDTLKIDGVIFDRQSAKRVFAHDGAKWWRSEDGGRAWQQVEVPEPSMREMMRGKLSGPEFHALAQDAGDPKIFYAGGSWSKDTGGAPVNKSINGGKKWEAAGTGITGSVTLLRPAAPGIVYAAVGKDGVYRTADAGKSWSLMGRPGEIRELAVDPTKPERLFVSAKGGLFRSVDSGATWAKVSQGVKGGDDVEAVAVSPSGKVFCGTFDGVFMSADGGDTWSAMNDGLLNTDVRALAIGGNRLYAGIAGGSVYSTEVP
ncbi:MAG TPA: hypothetical protein VNL91_07525 [Thermoanaerobaculia bacterium]|nr:hypothetical protein [Thermoanaerobaculia bacterium]